VAEKLNTRIDGVESRLDGRIDEVDKKLEKMDAKMDKRFDRMENFMIAMLESNRRLFNQLPGQRFNQE